MKKDLKSVNIIFEEQLWSRKRRTLKCIIAYTIYRRAYITDIMEKIEDFCKRGKCKKAKEKINFFLAKKWSCCNDNKQKNRNSPTNKQKGKEKKQKNGDFHILPLWVDLFNNEYFKLCYAHMFKNIY